MSLNTVFLLLAQQIALGILYARVPIIARQVTVYSINFGTSVFVSWRFFSLIRYFIGQLSKRRASPGENHRNCSKTDVYTGVVLNRTDSNSTLNLVNFERSGTAHSSLKAEDLKGGSTSPKEHLLSHSVSDDLLLELSFLIRALRVARSDLIQQQNTRMRIMPNLILAFFQYALLAGKRIRYISAAVSTQQEKFSVLLGAHMRLRSRYLDLITICTQSRESIKELKQSLELEAYERTKAQDTCERLLLEVDSSKKDCHFYKALASSVVARLGSLRTEHGQPLASTDLLGKGFSEFREYLRSTASPLDDSQDVTILDLVDHQDFAALGPLEVKQDIAKTTRSPEFARLNVSYALGLAGLEMDRGVGGVVFVPSSAQTESGCTESAVRKVKTIYEGNQRDAEGTGNKKTWEYGEDESRKLSLENSTSNQQWDALSDNTLENVDDIASSMEHNVTRDTQSKVLVSVRKTGRIHRLAEESKADSEDYSSTLASLVVRASTYEGMRQRMESAFQGSSLY